MNRIGIFYITARAKALGERLLSFFPEAELIRFSNNEVASRWSKAGAMIFIMATGIVVRTIGPLLSDKKTDPAVVVLDEQGRFVISLTGGHLGGANSLAMEISGLLGSEPVITTGSDVRGLVSVDLWARQYGMVIENPEVLPQVMARFLDNGALRIFLDGVSIDLPEQFIRVSEPRFADVLVTHREDVYLQKDLCRTEGCRVRDQLILRPKNLIVGIGFNRGTSGQEMLQVLRDTFRRCNLSLNSVYGVASLDKKTEEKGLREFSQALGTTCYGYSLEELNHCVRAHGLEFSEAAEKATGALAVAEPAAVLGARGGPLVVPKVRSGNVTLAVALRGFPEGKLYIVGTGPGALEDLTPRAREALNQAQVVVGYRAYMQRLGSLVAGKETFSTGMTKELDRCRKALEQASKGKIVAIVSGGDPGIYAMAGLVFELMNSDNSLNVEVEVVPGVSALNAVAAKLGAPLMHDFSVVSLSDRLTPWQVIQRRLDKAAEGDFVIVLFNPRSRGRPDHLQRALEIISKHRSMETPVGIVKAASREGERIILCTLGSVPVEEVDMETTVVIGNSRTFIYENFMVTPRGYSDKYEI